MLVGKGEKYMRTWSFSARSTWVAVLNISYASMHLLQEIATFLYPWPGAQILGWVWSPLNKASWYASSDAAAQRHDMSVQHEWRFRVCFLIVATGLKVKIIDYDDYGGVLCKSKWVTVCALPVILCSSRSKGNTPLPSVLLYSMMRL